MNDDLRRQIAVNLSSRATDELLEIWVANDHADWSDDAFDAIRSILEQRRVELPAQNGPGSEQSGSDDAGTMGEMVARRRGTAVFYVPAQVSRLVQQLDKSAPIAIVATIVAGLPALLSLYRTIASYFVMHPDGDLIALLIALPLGALTMVLPCWLIYFTLKSAAAVLRILMEMELNSRVDTNATSLELPVRPRGDRGSRHGQRGS